MLIAGVTANPGLNRARCNQDIAGWNVVTAITQPPAVIFRQIPCGFGNNSIGYYPKIMPKPGSFFSADPAEDLQFDDAAPNSFIFFHEGLDRQFYFEFSGPTQALDPNRRIN